MDPKMADDRSETSITNVREAVFDAAVTSSSAVVTPGIATDETGTGGSVGLADVTPSPFRQPNILMICAAQFRADFVGANGKNPSVTTPNIDALARRGVNFARCVSNQPSCSASRASFVTSRYATEAGLWYNGLELDHSFATIATEFRRNGYTSNFIGKWHLSSSWSEAGKLFGWVAPGPSRAGFDDLWEGANVLDLTSQPNAGSYWDRDGNDIGFRDVYRADFIAERGVKLIEGEHDKPWFLFLSQLEPHQQCDVDDFVPPKRYEGKYADPHLPPDLRNLPGNWRSRLPGYYGCVEAIDDCVGSLISALERTGQIDNTVVVFFSDHGNTFRTRQGEYKRSPHESSIRVPFIIAGPGFDHAITINEIVSLLDLTPTLLDAAGIEPPAGMRGKPLKSLAVNPQVRANWNSTAYFQISESYCGRGIRTSDWCYCAIDPSQGRKAKFGRNYQDFALYSLVDDPDQLINLVGRPEYKVVADRLRAELHERIVAAGEPEPTITGVHFYA